MFRSIFASPKTQRISPAQAKIRLDSGEAIALLDVRTAEEYAHGHIARSQLLPLNLLPALAQERLPDRDGVIFVYCQSGGRSAQAARVLENMGYTQVHDLGGIMDWPYGTTRN